MKEVALQERTEERAGRGVTEREEGGGAGVVAGSGNRTELLVLRRREALKRDGVLVGT